MKNYLIIGGSSGIGKAIVDILDEKNNVFATYNSSTDFTSDSRYFHLDVTGDEVNLNHLPDVIDGLAYCPGNINLKPFHRFKIEDFTKDFNLQLVGAVKVIQACLSRLKQSESSSIVLFSSVAVQTGFTFHSVVASSKGAIEGLTKSLAAELSPNIRVNCIAPSLTDTPLAKNLLNSPEKLTSNGERHPLKRVGKSEDIAEIANFLLSDASSWITGQVIGVDGGMSTIKTG